LFFVASKNGAFTICYFCAIIKNGLGECTFKNQKGVFFIYPNEETNQRTNTGIDLYEAYATFMSLANVRRMGFAKCGSNGRPLRRKGLNEITEPFFKMREQSDAEHTFGTMVLAFLLPIFYPDTFTKEDTLAYIATMLHHELGEVVCGDIPEDGTRINASQDKQELSFLKKFLSEYYPREAAEENLTLYRGFLDKNTEIGRNAFLIDKTDAVLYNLFLEQSGRPGSIKWRTEHFGCKTAEGVIGDSECAEITKSDLPSDNWLCSLVSNTKEVLTYSDFVIFREIIQSAAYVVRGGEMDWLKSFHYESKKITP